MSVSINPAAPFRIEITTQPPRPIEIKRPGVQGVAGDITPELQDLADQAQASANTATAAATSSSSSASAAADSETNAAGSATAASTSEANAANSASEAAASAASIDVAKLAGIEAGAEVNVQSDWNASTGDAFIQNKPALGSAASQDVTAFATAAEGALATSAMQPATYDPGNVGANAFDQDNMIDGTTNKNYTAAEQVKLSGIEAGAEVNLPVGTTTGTVAAGDDSRITGAVQAANNLSDLDDAQLARSNIDAAADPVTPDFTGAVPIALKLITQDHVDPAWFGLTGGAVEDLAFTRAMTAAITDIKPVKIDGSYTLDTIDLSSVTAGGALRIEHNGTLTHVAAASTHMFALGTRDYVEFTGPGIFDGQQASQTVDTIIIPVDSITHFYLRGSRFKNVKKGAVHQRSSAVGDIFRMDQFTVKDGALHDGTLNGKQCNFIRIAGGQLIHISDYRMIQTADPAAGQNRNPSGIFYINTGGPAVAQKVIIENGYLENLGYHCAGNAVGVIDFYSRCEHIRLWNHTIRKPRLLPIRTNFASTIEITGNDIDHPYQCIIDGAGNYPDEACISASIVDRQYPTDNGGVDTLTIAGNVVTIANNNCMGAAISGGGSTLDTFMHVAEVSGNSFTSTGTNTQQGCFVFGVTDYLSENNRISGFTQGVRYNGGAVGSVIAAERAKALFHKDKINGVGVGIWARTNMSNVDVTVDDCELDATSLSYSIENAKDVRVKDNTLSDPGDAQNNAAFWYKDNDAGGTGNPAGYTTNAYYRLKDNVGRADAASA